MQINKLDLGSKVYKVFNSSASPSWCQKEADKIVARLERLKNMNAGAGAFSPETEVIFEAGFGPSGLPHIGTLCEVLRLDLVRKAFERKTGRSGRLLVVSDDMDALRKVPSNFHHAERLFPSVGLPLCEIPDPYGEHNSFSEGINQRLLATLAKYKIDFEFIRNSISYRAGEYNEILLEFLRNYQSLNQIIGRTLGAVRQQSYNIFMPISPDTGKVIEHIRILEVDIQQGLLTYEIPPDILVQRPGAEYSITAADYYPDEQLATPITISVLNGNCKLQWKADWAMRLIARNVSYEMHGDDLLDSARMVDAICQVLRREKPVLFHYGLFSDQDGKKISKSKGNGFSLEEVREFLPPAALQHFLFKSPQRPSRFAPALTPVLVDGYLRDRRMYEIQDVSEQACNALHYMRELDDGDRNLPKYGKLLNIINACEANNLELIFHYLGKYQIQPRKDGGQLHQLLQCVENFYHATILPKKQLMPVPASDLDVMQPLAGSLAALRNAASPTEIHICLMSIKERLRPELPLVEWYQLIYRCAFGQQHGPRLLNYIQQLGVLEFSELLRKRHEFLLLMQVKSNSARTSSLDGNESELVAAVKSLDKDCAKKITTMTSNIPNSSLLTPIDFDAVLTRATKFADYLRLNVEVIAHSLAGFECFNVAVDEVERSVEFLTNLHLNREYFRYMVGGVTTFLPLNQPLYATVCFGVVPSLMAREVYLRPPTAMQHHYKKLCAALHLEQRFENLHISYDDKDVFVMQRAPRTEAVIFTGTPENAAKVRSKFLRRTLFILNGAGHNPLLIAEDADVASSIHSALRVVLYNQGQDCAGPNSILVHATVYDKFVAGLKHELTAIAHLVGPYENKQNIVGPNSDIDHTLKISKIFKEERSYCTYGGEINPVNGLIRPAIFEKPLKLGGNYREFFAPVFFVQKYHEDTDLHEYFGNIRYQPNAMYISLFGTSAYVEEMVAQGVHPQETILRETDLHHTEKGYFPYGGLGPAASCLYVNGERRDGATLPQRDMYLHLVKPFEISMKEISQNSDVLGKYA